jgi:hypothetical protein
VRVNVLVDMAGKRASRDEWRKRVDRTETTLGLIHFGGQVITQLPLVLAKPFRTRPD